MKSKDFVIFVWSKVISRYWSWENKNKLARQRS